MADAAARATSPWPDGSALVLPGPRHRWRAINHRLVMLARKLAARSPPERLHYRQPAGDDDGKRRPARPRRRKADQGHKRHILTDILELLLDAVVHVAGIQDRDRGPALLKWIHRHFPWFSHIFADGGYAGAQFASNVMKSWDWTIEIVKSSDTADGLVVLPRRCVRERPRARLSGSSLAAQYTTRKITRC